VAYALLYHPLVATDDIPAIPRNLQGRLARAIETRLATAPERYGEPLRGPFQGYRKLRVGDYRVVYRIVKQEVWVLAILHRKRVYDLAGARRRWHPPSRT
jgi:mRNA interferase RelE/StbE